MSHSSRWHRQAAQWHAAQQPRTLTADEQEDTIERLHAGNHETLLSWRDSGRVADDVLAQLQCSVCGLTLSQIELAAEDAADDALLAEAQRARTGTDWRVGTTAID